MPLVMLQRLITNMRERLRPAPVASAEALRQFLEQRALLIAQKCAIDYCRGKTGLASYALFTEKPFLDALDVCRWESFAAVLGDLLLIAEGRLRPHVPPERLPALREALLGLYRQTLAALPLPPHRAAGWADAIAEFAARLASAAAGPPRQALDVADHSARRLFDTLPIHSNMRELDEEPVFGAVRFRMIAVSQEMQRRIAAAQVAAGLAG
jgi:hypothetical protein